VPHRAAGLTEIDHRDRRHVAALPGLDKMIDADEIVRGDGISWMRNYLGEDDKAPIIHPEIVSGTASRSMGMKLPVKKGATAATHHPFGGCPMGCNFCTTSAFFGGKGKFLNFYDTGDELFGVMSEMERKLHVQSIVSHHGCETSSSTNAAPWSCWAT